MLQFIKLITLKKLWNFCKVKIHYFLVVLGFRNISFHTYPTFLSIEPTNSCNLQCPECPSGLKILHRPKGNMPLPIFERILDETYSHLITLMLYFQGEPFLNKHIIEMCAVARKKKIYTIISTNGNLLNSDLIKDLAYNGPDRLIISIDGITQQTYETYRKGGDIKKVIDGIIMLLDEKKKIKSNIPHIILQCLLFEHNMYEKPMLEAFAKKLGLKVEFKQPQLLDPSKPIARISVNKKSRYHLLPNGKFIPKHKSRVCNRIYEGLVITWDGSVVPCCYDKDANYELGNLNNTNLIDIWGGSKLETYRIKVATNRQSIPICCNCGE